MPLTLAIADNADGTGATATVAGTGGAAVAVRASKVVGTDWPAADWVGPYTRTGDGTVAVPVGFGTWFGFATAGAEQTTPVPFSVTDPTNAAPAIATLCRDAVAARLALLALPGCRRVWSDEAWLEAANKDYPCVALTTEGLSEFEQPGLDGLDLIGHPVRVSICDKTELRDTLKLRQRYEPWRQRISDAFRWAKLPGVSANYLQTTVEHLDIADARNPQYMGFVSALILWCWVYRTRGF